MPSVWYLAKALDTALIGKDEKGIVIPDEALAGFDKVSDIVEYLDNQSK